MFFISYNTDPPIANKYNYQRRELDDLLDSLSRTQIHYINYVLDFSYAGLMIGLPTSPTHFLLALRLSPSYWDAENNMVYVYYNSGRQVVFLGALFRALGRAHIYSLARQRDDFFFPLASDVFGYFVEFSMGIKSVAFHQAEKVADLLGSGTINVENRRILQDLVAKALAILLVRSTKFGIHDLARILSKDPKTLVSMGSDLGGKLEIIWRNAVDSLMAPKKEVSKGSSDRIMEILSEDELDKLTYDLLLALASLLQYIRVRGLSFVQAKYSHILDRLMSFKPLKSNIASMLRDPDGAIEQLNAILPGINNIVSLVHPEAIISQIFEE